MPLNGIRAASHALGYYAREQEVVANNLANANTDGYKAHHLTAQRMGRARYPEALESIDLRQAPFRETGRQLDLALRGDGFFVVQTERGERLIRGGSFRLDGDGVLTDREGNTVLGTGGPLVLHGADVTVHPDGQVVVDGQLAGQLRIETVDDAGALVKEQGNRFAFTAPLHAVPDGRTQVHQGAIEDANIDPVLSMIDLVTIQRAFSANVDALKAMDGVLGTITGQVGRVE
jgi:flagellar basal body rod protein FlgG